MTTFEIFVPAEGGFTYHVDADTEEAARERLGTALEESDHFGDLTLVQDGDKLWEGVILHSEDVNEPSQDQRDWTVESLDGDGEDENEEGDEP